MRVVDPIRRVASTLLGAALASGVPGVSSAETVVNGAGEVQAVEARTTAAGATAGGVGGDAVLLYCGNGGNCAEGVTQLTAHYVGLGAGVDLLFTLPSDLSAYRLVFIILPGVSFGPTQVDALDAFVRGGGRL